MSNIYTDLIWKNKPEYLREFYKNLKKYQSLCDEVSYILNTEIKSKRIEVASINKRTKTESSFCEKIHRKSYENPFTEITDFSGVRVVYLYHKDRADIQTIINDNFEVIEFIDKVSDNETDQFGYGAIHYLVKLKEIYTGARYKEISGLVCEIQVRTILQDAWALVAHHLSYKQESEVPPHLRRKLNALSGLFETADDQFENIRAARVNYQETIASDINKNRSSSLKQEMNLDNLTAYIKWKFPTRPVDKESSIQELLSELIDFGYEKLDEIDKIVDRTTPAIIAYESKYPPADEDAGCAVQYSGVGMIRGAIEFIDDTYLNRSNYDWSYIIQQKLEFKDLVEPA